MGNTIEYAHVRGIFIITAHHAPFEPIHVTAHANLIIVHITQVKHAQCAKMGILSLELLEMELVNVYNLAHLQDIL